MGFRVREQRIAAGMTLAELAEKSGVPAETIAGIENGTSRRAYVRHLLDIAQALNTTIEKLFWED